MTAHIAKFKLPLWIEKMLETQSGRAAMEELMNREDEWIRKRIFDARSPIVAQLRAELRNRGLKLEKI